MKRALLLAALAVTLVAGCGGDEEAAPTGETTVVKVYWLLDGKVWPARRQVEAKD